LGVVIARGPAPAAVRVEPVGVDFVPELDDPQPAAAVSSAHVSNAEMTPRIGLSHPSLD
jgi:hypothetical protein